MKNRSLMKVKIQCQPRKLKYKYRSIKCMSKTTNCMYNSLTLHDGRLRFFLRMIEFYLQLTQPRRR